MWSLNRVVANIYKITNYGPQNIEQYTTHVTHFRVYNYCTNYALTEIFGWHVYCGVNKLNANFTLSFPNGRGSRVAGFKSRVAGFK